MVVLLPQTSCEKVRVCLCGAMGLCSPIRARSSFCRDNHAKSGYRSRCRVCDGQRNRLRHRRRESSTLEERERRRRGGPRLPIEPFRQWIEYLLRELEYQGIEAPSMVLAARLEVKSRTIYTWRYQLKTVCEKVVDWSASCEGRWTAEEIYELNWSTNERPTRSSERHVCATTGCTERAPSFMVDGSGCAVPGRFCAEHSAVLGRLRLELETEQQRYVTRRLKPKRRSVCENPMCDNSRPVTESFCVECRDDGWGGDE